MKITLSPMRRDDQLTLSKSGDTLTINGDVFDFSAIPEGATLPRAAVDCDWLASDVERIDGVLYLTLILPHGARAPVETRFPAVLDLTTDGPVTLPAYDIPEVLPEELQP
tara:strand:- start:3739 stop:4068 length:330 start_codon:yes stop_codon:yes gene_type:complete